MEYLNIKEYSKIWGISERRIMKLCVEGRIPGSYKKGRIWNIPVTASKPLDMRKRSTSYIDDTKRVLILNCLDEISKYIGERVNNKGYSIEYKNNIADIESKYYYGVIIFNNGKNIENIIEKLSSKLNSESSVIVVSNKKFNIENKFLKEIGFRINMMIVEDFQNEINEIDYKAFANDLCNLFFDFKYSNNVEIKSNYTIIKYSKDLRTKKYTTGEYYKILNYLYDNLESEDTLYLISPMMETEWTESALEMNFRIINMNALNRGAKIERIFVFDKKKIDLYKNNKTLEIFLNSDMYTFFVDSNDLNREQLEKIGSGIGLLNDELFICDLPDTEKYRAFLSINKNDLKKNKKIYDDIKKYAIKLKEVMK